MAAEIGASKRVGLIGCGWYGKCDLLRLLQVAPVDIVALCDVDRNLLNEAGTIIAGRQASRKTPRLHGDDLKRTLAWQAADHKVRGDDEANQRLARAYRGPWKHPGA